GAQGPGLAAALRDRIECPRGERLPSLLVRHVCRVDPSLGCRPRDDLLVDVEEAEAVGDEPADFFAARPGGMGDADEYARHRGRRYERRLSASSVGLWREHDR